MCLNGEPTKKEITHCSNERSFYNKHYFKLMQIFDFFATYTFPEKALTFIKLRWGWGLYPRLNSALSVTTRSSQTLSRKATGDIEARPGNIKHDLTHR